jgi:predicted metal-dependent hydrolase
LVKSTQPKVYLKDSHFYVFSNKINLKSNLESWFKTESLNYFTTRTFELAQQYGFDKLTAIKVRKMRSSWGNCRSNGLITFNYNLIKAPIELIDYVIIHELCHLLQPNHSNKFYQLQASILPHWKQLKSQLDQMAASII